MVSLSSTALPAVEINAIIINVNLFLLKNSFPILQEITGLFISQKIDINSHASEINFPVFCY